MSNTYKALNGSEQNMNTHSMKWNLTINDLSYVRSRGHEGFNEAIANLLIWNIPNLFKPFKT